MITFEELQKRIEERRRQIRRAAEAEAGHRCPACGSGSVEEYPESERMEGLAMYWFTGFPQATAGFLNSFRCTECGHEW